MLNKSVVETDARLEKAQSRSLEELAQHRWHWTLDETNPDRVSIREYARQIGRNYGSVYSMATGYSQWHQGDHEIVISEVIERTKVGAEKEAVIDAIASAEGIKFNTAKDRHDEVREVRTIAQERAERKGTSVEEEAPRVAAQRVQARQAGQRIREEHTARHTFRYIEIEGDLSAALRRLTHALSTAQDVGWESDEIELLSDMVGRVRAVLNLIDLRIAGETNVDWDNELAKLTKEE